MELARQRPESGSGASGEDYRYEHLLSTHSPLLKQKARHPITWWQQTPFRLAPDYAPRNRSVSHDALMINVAAQQICGVVLRHSRPKSLLQNLLGCKVQHGGSSPQQRGHIASNVGSKPKARNLPRHPQTVQLRGWTPLSRSTTSALWRWRSITRCTPCGILCAMWPSQLTEDSSFGLIRENAPAGMEARSIPEFSLKTPFRAARIENTTLQKHLPYGVASLE